ncbi:MAG: type II secretion system F family protein [Alphaproteobacteria bacterium]|nr:type II secretion system F family protein [Alphaproteobacteria bacterium]
MSGTSLAEAFSNALTFQIGALGFGPIQTIIFVVALTAALVAGADLWRIGQREDRQMRLDALRGVATDRTTLPSNRGPRWYERVGAVVAASRIVGIAEQQRLLGALGKAGLRRPGALARLVASKVGAALVLAGLIWGLLNAGELPVGQVIYRLVLVGGALMLGWRLPDFTLARLAVRRCQRLEEGMPDALDLLVIAAEAGLSLDQAIEEVARNLLTSNRPTAEEFATAAAEMRVLANRSEALENLVKRSELPSLRSVAATLSQSLRFGTPLAQSLRLIAAEMRNDRIARMEERAARLPVLLAIPMMLFILPSLMIVIGTPMGLHVVDTLKQVFAAHL